MRSSDPLDDALEAKTHSNTLLDEVLLLRIHLARRDHADCKKLFDAARGEAEQAAGLWPTILALQCVRSEILEPAGKGE